METFAIGLFAGILGTAYFLYGKRQAKLSALVSGCLLCVYPYFVTNLVVSLLIGLALAIVPFVVDV